MEAFNPKLCEERHDDIREDRVEMFTRIKKVENRFLIIMTVLVANLFGVIGSLFVLLTKG